MTALAIADLNDVPLEPRSASVEEPMPDSKTPPVSREAVLARAAEVAAIAKRHAAETDIMASFPKHAFDAIRAQRLLGLSVPQELGGEGFAIGEIADICYRLGQACSSTAMIYAMHQVKVGCILHHYKGAPWHANLLGRLAREQLLFASSTTEGQGGGNVRSSAAAIQYRDDDTISLTRSATVISYGAHADAVVTTARRAEDAPASDQVLAVFMKGDYALEPMANWDALGMRGTCSSGYTLKAHGLRTQILAESYDKIHSQSMVPYAHILWSSAWAGIAAAAVERAQGFIRHAARQSQGQLPPAAAHLTRATSTLRTLRGLITASLAKYEQARKDERLFASLDFQTAITLTKVEASELAVSTVMSAYRAAGLAGYRNDSEFSIGRYLRDILSSPIMINNERILGNIATAALMAPIPSSITE